MEFVETSDQRCHDERDAGPLHRPAPALHQRNGRSPGAIEKKAQSKIPANVACLTYIEIPNLKSRRRDVEDKMENRIKNSAGVAGGEPVGRLNGDEDQPKNYGYPSLPNLILARVQSLAQRLFRRVVRRLARDHDIMHMTLAQACHADAHKPRLLQ